jgi:hypothetical protein
LEPVITCSGDAEGEFWRGELCTLAYDDFTTRSTAACLWLHATEGHQWEPDRVRFPGLPSRWPERMQCVELDFAYCLTLPEAACARWDKVVVIDEMRRDDPARRRWLGSAMLCASKQVTIISRH